MDDYKLIDDILGLILGVSMTFVLFKNWKGLKE
jgi:hypothetical protein